MKNKKIWIAAALAVILISGAVSAFMLFRKHGKTVEIISDGKTIYTLDLSLEDDREITVEYKNRINVITIKDGDIWMSEAECPDHTCIKTGHLSQSGVPIVCLPNKLMIRYKEGGELDAATQ